MSTQNEKGAPNYESAPMASGDVSTNGSTPKDPHGFMPMHVEVLKDRGVDPQLAWDAGLRSLDLRSELVRSVFKKRYPGQPTYPSTALLISSNSHDADGSCSEHWRLRWDEKEYHKHTPNDVPGTAFEGEVVPIPRYTTKKGATPPPFIAPAVNLVRVQQDAAKPIFFVEAALKALSLQTIGLDAIGLCGVEVGAKDPEFWGLTRMLSIHPELKRFRWKERVTFVSFDAGAQHNAMVAFAQARLCFVLDKEGAEVRIVQLPERDRDADVSELIWTEFDDQGPDDFIHFKGRDAYHALVTQAVPGNPLAWLHHVIAAYPGESKDQIGMRLAALLRDIQFVALLEVFPKATRDQLAKEFKRYAAIGAKAIQDAIQQFKARRTEKLQCEQETRHPYAYVDGRTVIKHVPTDRVLAEFEARIERDVMIDDGIEQTRAFEITGITPSGVKLAKLTIPSVDFADMKWPIEGWGNKATVPAGRDTREQLRAAIQYLSTPKEAKVYSHTGWTQHNGANVYLHAGGAVGTADEVSVQCDGRFSIANACSDMKAAIQRSLSTLNAGPPEIMIPALAAVYTAPLASHAKVNTALWLYGRTGSCKSGLAGLMTSHYGQFSFDSHLESFQSTALHMAAVGFKYKDALLTIDDYVPSSNPAMAKNPVDAIDQLMHNIGDNAGRGRASRDGNAKDGKPVRAMVMFTGEDPPPSKTASTNARLVVIEIKPGQIQRGMLIEFERHRGQLQQSMRGYLEWLASRLDRVAEWQLQEIERFRTLLAVGTHSRVAAALGTLSTGIRLFLRYAVESQALTQEEHDKLLAQFDSALRSLGDRQIENLAGKNVVDQLRDTVRKLLLTGRIRLVPIESALTERTEQNCCAVGWNDTSDRDYVYMEKSILWDAVVEHHRRLGEEWAHSATNIFGQLADAGVVKRDGKNLERKKTAGGARQRVLYIRRAWLEVDATPEEVEAERLEGQQRLDADRGGVSAEELEALIAAAEPATEIVATSAPNAAVDTQPIITLTRNPETKTIPDCVTVVATEPATEEWSSVSLFVYPMTEGSDGYARAFHPDGRCASSSMWDHVAHGRYVANAGVVVEPSGEYRIVEFELLAATGSSTEDLTV